jgi:beta-glucosidase-like glycosyl hydrolase
LFENPYVEENQVSLQSDSAKNLAKEVALQSVVLLENGEYYLLTSQRNPSSPSLGRRRVISGHV